MRLTQHDEDERRAARYAKSAEHRERELRAEIYVLVFVLACAALGPLVAAGFRAWG